MGKWQKIMLLSVGTLALNFYDMATRTEAPSQAVAILEYVFVGCALVGLAGALVMLASQK